MTVEEVMKYLEQLVSDKGTEHLNFDGFWAAIEERKQEGPTIFSFEIDIHVPRFPYTPAFGTKL